MVVDLVLATSVWVKVIVWSPAIIIGGGIVGAVTILLGRAFADSVRESRHPRWIMGGLVALFFVCIFLTYLGVSLPKE